MGKAKMMPMGQDHAGEGRDNMKRTNGGIDKVVGERNRLWELLYALRYPKDNKESIYRDVDIALEEIVPAGNDD